MMKPNRRDFLFLSATAIAHAFLPRSPASAHEKGMRLGVFVDMAKNPEAAIAQVSELGFPTCQTSMEDFDPGFAKRLLEASSKQVAEVTALRSIGIFILGMRGRRQETACDGVESKVVSDDQGGEAENRLGAIIVKGAECIAILRLSPLIRPGNEISRRPVKSGTARTHTSSGRDARQPLHLAWARSGH